MARRVDRFILFILVNLDRLVSVVQPNKRDKPNKPTNGFFTLADFFSILLQFSHLDRILPYPTLTTIVTDLYKILPSDKVSRDPGVGIESGIVIFSNQ
jgi:hypothetical protein